MPLVTKKNGMRKPYPTREGDQAEDEDHRQPDGELAG
jgi:hypothetical protein